MRLFWPAVTAAAMFAVLCGLGVWQVQRLHWKTALLARIDAAERAPGVDVPDVPQAFEKVRVTGRLRPELGRYAVEARDIGGQRVLGSQVVGLLDVPPGAPVVAVLGWLPDDAPFASPADAMTLEGYVREPAKPGWFTPPDDPGRRHFYTLDPAVIGRVLGAATVAPFSIVRLGPPDAPGEPVPAEALPRPPNDHLSYAITWFGLALTLLVVFALFIRRPRPA